MCICDAERPTGPPEHGYVVWHITELKDLCGFDPLRGAPPPQRSSLGHTRCADLREPRGARVRDNSPIANDFVDHLVEMHRGHRLAPREHLTGQWVKQLLEPGSRNVLRCRELVTVALLTPKAHTVLDGKHDAWQRISQVSGDIDDVFGRNRMLVQDLPAPNVVDECPVAAQGEPMGADEISNTVQPPRWPRGHQHHLNPCSLDSGQRRPGTPRTGTVAAQQRPVEVCGYQSDKLRSRHD